MAEAPGSSDRMNVSKRVVWHDQQTGDRGSDREHTTVDGDRTEITLHGSTSLTPPRKLTSFDRAVAAWELSKYVARENLAADERQIPEAARRSAARKLARKADVFRDAGVGAACATCGNTGWVEDPIAGTGGQCPHCDAAPACE